MRITDISRPQAEGKLSIPVAGADVQAGFPSPAEDYIEKRLDLNELMIKHPAATFFVRTQGESMRDAGIQSGDILIVDRSLEPASGKLIVAVLNGEFTVKRFVKRKGKLYLVAENPDYPDICVEPDSDFQVWGVVTYVIHQCTP